jgi:hypothetical protein
MTGLTLCGACREEQAAPAAARGDDAKPARRDGWIDVSPKSEAVPAPAEVARGEGPHDSTDDEAPPLERQDVTPMALLADAETGEWARYRTHQGWTQQYRLTKVGARRVSVEVRVVGRDGPLGLPSTRREPADLDWALDRAESHEAGVHAEDARVEAAGRSWICRLTVARFESGGAAFEQRTWMSADAPVYGLVKAETINVTTGEVIAGMTLTGFGVDAAAPSAAHAAAEPAR